MADTQWIGTDDGKNPNSVAVDIINQLNQQFIDRDVRFVVQVGDLVDGYSTASMATTAIFRQALYDHRIGFYPLRGNHEGNAAAASQFVGTFPQTQTGVMNSTPASAWSIVNPDALTQPFPAQPATPMPFTVGTISATPASPAGFAGLCYAFDYKNARFVMLDQFTPTTGTSHSVLDSAQVDWMNGQLAGRSANTQAFVFAHKGIITENHVDTLFGANPSINPALQNTMQASLAANGVRYAMGGHDHMYNRALVAGPDGTSAVQDLTLASDSSKFYIPFGTAGYVKRLVDPVTKAVSNDRDASGNLVALPSADPQQTNDYVYDMLVAGGATRETPLAQELNTVGYYIFSVDGPKVTVDYYAAFVYPNLASGEYLLTTTPTMVFTKRDTFGYSLNGKEFLVPQGATYATVADSFRETKARVLAGANGSTAKDSSGRSFTKAVDTGWDVAHDDDSRLASEVLTLWGMDDLGADHTDTYALSLTYDRHERLPSRLHSGDLVIATQDARGRWINAVDANNGGTKGFVAGPWKSSYGLGTYGVDQKTHTAWAVVDHDGAFAVARDVKDAPGHDR